MTSISGALIPVFALILVGVVLARLSFPEPGFWPQAERLIYFLLFPSLLFSSLAVAPLRDLELVGMVSALVLGVAGVSVLLLVLRPLLGISGAEFGSLFQGAIRQNTYVGLAGAAAVAGEAGTILAAVAIATLIPLLNLLCVVVLVAFGRGRGGSGAIVRELVRNPLIIACVAGISFNLGGLILPDWLRQLLDLLGSAALPLGLLAVGAGLRLEMDLRRLGTISLSSIVKLLMLPLVVWLLCRQMSVPAGATQIAVLFAALPTSVSSYILARQLDGDEDLMAGIITAQTLLAMISLPILLDLAR